MLWDRNMAQLAAAQGFFLILFPTGLCPGAINMMPLTAAFESNRLILFSLVDA